jgi:hypothetical protein
LVVCDFFIRKGLKYDTVAYIKHLSFTEWQQPIPANRVSNLFSTVLGDNRMNKKIVALAVAAAFAVPVAASAQTTLFGQFKYEVGYIDDQTATTATSCIRTRAPVWVSAAPRTWAAG